jgi:ABC-type proline/glycine betaine transport system substrate-binding protein
MKSHRIAAFAIALFAITFAGLPRNAAALRQSGGTKIKYMNISSGSSLTDAVVTVIESVSSTIL